MHVMQKSEVLQFVANRRELLDGAGQSNPFVSSAWLLHFIEQITPADAIFVVAESAIGGESVMLLHGNPTTAYRLASVANYYSSLYSPIITSAVDSHAAVEQIAGEVTAARPRKSILDLSPLCDDGNTRVLRDALAEHGWYPRQYFCFGNWYLPTSNLSFDAYMERRPSQLRSTWLRKSKKFRTEGHGTLELITDVNDVERALKAFQTIYSKSWKKPEPYADFVPQWARVSARNGWLRMGIARLGDMPIAAQFWFTRHGRAHIFKLAYDDEYSRWSAGTLLTAFMIQHSLETDKVDEIDYLTGDDDYKKSWMTERRERVGIRACNLSTARGLLAAAREASGRLRNHLSNAGYRTHTSVSEDGVETGSVVTPGS